MVQTDLLIQHDGTDTEIYNKTGNLKIRANDLDIQDYTNGHSMITADRDGSQLIFSMTIIMHFKQLLKVSMSVESQQVID